MIRIKQYNTWKQYFSGIGVIILTSLVLYPFVDFIGYRVVALILLLIVSLLAMLFDIFPVLVIALLSALIWNYFFIPPTFTFHVGTPEDALMFLMYFVVALINTVLMFKIREYEKKMRDKEDRENAVKLYNTLLNSLSHELRTPIATIIGSIDTIMANESKLSEDNKHALYREIEKAGVRLNRQVENLLSMSRLEAGVLKPNPDWCDVNEIIHKLLAACREHAGNRRVLFEANEDLPLFLVDRGLIEQILNNILDNAIKYTPEQSSISVAVYHQADSCCFVIADSGPGFAEHELSFVFDRFYRLPGSKAGGLGLGLSIASSFTEALNGTIQVENRKEGGAQFTITIPAKASSLKEMTDD